MAADPERPPADDTIVVGADEWAAEGLEQGWPVDDHYLVQPESEAGGVPVTPTVESAPVA